MRRRVLCILFAALVSAPSSWAAPAYQEPLPYGAVAALRGTPHLWIADEQGILHWAGDTRALAGRFVDWGSRTEVTADALKALPRGDPWLSAGLLKMGDPIYLVKWESSAAEPELLHIQSISDVELFGIESGNYGRMVIERPEWERRFGMDPTRLKRGVLAPALEPPVPSRPTLTAGTPLATAEANGWRLSVFGIYRGYTLPAPYDSWTAIDSELVALHARVENVSAAESSCARRDLHLLYDGVGQTSRTPVGDRDRLTFTLPWQALEIPDGGGAGEFPRGSSVTGVVTFPGRPELKPAFLILLVASKHVLLQLDRLPIRPIDALPR